MTLPQIPVPQPVPPRPQPPAPVDFFRRMPGGGTAYVKPPTALSDPNACGACDAPKDTHAQRPHPDLGMHGWIAPDDETRKARMIARRTARTQETPR